MPIHPTAIVDPTAVVDPTCDIGPYARIEANVVLGPGNVVMQGAVICRNTVVGEANVFHYNCLIGGDPQFLGFDPRTNSGTRIGSNNHFRELCQVHRGLKDGQHTVIGDGNFLMATAHVAHDCVLGNHNVIANNSGLAGHVTVGDRCFISTLVGVHQFCRIGSYAMIGAISGVPKDVPPFVTVRQIGVIVGLNVVGLRRAGISADTRMALRRAYKELFRSGRALPRSIAAVRASYGESPMPAEVAQFLDFCATPSKRGLCRGPRQRDAVAEEDGDE
jgi:UDP-N-acetylglucosamine acyltransferase